MASTVSALRSSDDVLQPIPGGATPGVFISAESLTFPTAAAISAALVGSLRLFVGGAAENVWWVLAVCVVVGGLIIVMGWPTPDPNRERTPADTKRVVVYVIAGLLNILLLFSSVMGIVSISTQEVPSLPPTP